MYRGPRLICPSLLCPDVSMAGSLCFGDTHGVSQTSASMRCQRCFCALAVRSVCVCVLCCVTCSCLSPKLEELSAMANVLAATVRSLLLAWAAITLAFAWTGSLLLLYDSPYIQGSLQKVLLYFPRRSFSCRSCFFHELPKAFENHLRCR